MSLTAVPAPNEIGHGASSSNLNGFPSSPSSRNSSPSSPTAATLPLVFRIVSISFCRSTLTRSWFLAPSTSLLLQKMSSGVDELSCGAVRIANSTSDASLICFEVDASSTSTKPRAPFRCSSSECRSRSCPGKSTSCVDLPPPLSSESLPYVGAMDVTVVGCAPWQSRWKMTVLPLPHGPHITTPSTFVLTLDPIDPPPLNAEASRRPNIK
mmetsp:Transcript_18789/g.43721  ORF Transcript_18789/g.43721 Transcript_18789/m.43721 type:complete len:211 (+) Transcript_18789:133-765(+)